MNEDCNIKDFSKIYRCDYMNNSPCDDVFKSTDIVGGGKPVFDILNPLKVCVLFLCFGFCCFLYLPPPLKKKNKKKRFNPLTGQVCETIVGN